MAKSEVLQIPGVQKEQLTVTIEGITPLITNRFSDKSKKQMLDKQMKRPTGKKEAKDPEADYLGSIYRTEDGRPGYPASGIKQACVSACRYVDDVPMTIARGAFFIMGKILPVDGEHEMGEDIVRLGGKTADIRYRAYYPKWSITFDVLYNPRIILPEGIVNLIEIAGFHVGIGDWRPEKNGTNGMFQVKREE